jgi:hypothetical protein
MNILKGSVSTQQKQICFLDSSLTDPFKCSGISSLSQDRKNSLEASQEMKNQTFAIKMFDDKKLRPKSAEVLVE